VIINPDKDLAIYAKRQSGIYIKPVAVDAAAGFFYLHSTVFDFFLKTGIICNRLFIDKKHKII